jgi:hypothetical protein
MIEIRLPYISARNIDLYCKDSSVFNIIFDKIDLINKYYVTSKIQVY